MIHTERPDRDGLRWSGAGMGGYRDCKVVEARKKPTQNGAIRVKKLTLFEFLQ